VSFVPRTLEDLAYDFPPALQHLSASSLKMAVRCEEQWRQRYILGRREVPNLNMLTGRADHAAIERSMVQKIETYVDMPVGEVKAAYVETLENAVEESGGLYEIEVRDADTKAAKVRAFDEQRSHGQQVVAAYHTIVSPHLQPTAVEKKFEIQVPDVPVVLLGYQDLIVETGNGDRIIDRKRSGRAKTKPEAEWLLQADIYQLADPLPHDWHVSVTTKTPRVQTPVDNEKLTRAVQPRERVERQVSMLVQKLGWLYQTFGPDDAWPTTGTLHPWACSFCGFKPLCWAHR
jgi:hypothetical protein